MKERRKGGNEEKKRKGKERRKGKKEERERKDEKNCMKGNWIKSRG